jgi:UDP-glucose 4-epimerase
LSSILITGIAGFIGSVVAEFLDSAGHKLIGIDNLQEGNRKAVSKNALFYEGNFGDKELLNTVFGNNHVDYVFHFAAETTIEFSMTEPYKYFQNNVVNGLNLLEAMREHSCRKLVFSSTAATYGEPRYNPIDEQHPQITINAYGESKLLFERILEWYHKSYGFSYNLFRYFNASGATKLNGEDRKNESHLLPVAFSVVNGKRKLLKVYGNDYPTKDGTCVRDYVHVGDIADAHILAMENLKIRPNAKYNLGSGSGFTILEVIEMIESVTKKKIEWTYEGRRTGDPALLVASNSLAISQLKWNPNRSTLLNIVESAYKWSIEHPNGYN